MISTNKLLFTTISAGLFFFGLYELTSGIALIGLFAWLVLVSVCAAGATMRHASPSVITYSRADAKARSAAHYTKTEWNNLCVQYNNVCLCCGKRRKLTADHIVPLYLGGSDDISNIQPLCGPCNSSKGAQAIDYRSTQ